MTTPPTPASTPDHDAPDARLDTERAFRRFVERVTPDVYRWLGWWRVPEAERDDLVQEILQATYKRRASFDPARGRYEAWAYGFCVLMVMNHRRRTGRKNRREAVPRDDLPQVSTGEATPEERIILRRLLYKCLSELDEPLAAIFMASEVDGIPMADIAAAHDISLSTAYACLKEAREKLQRALDDVQEKKRRSGAIVLPIALGQLVASDRGVHATPPATMRRVWKHLDRLIKADKASGALGHDDAPSPHPRGRLGSRAVRAVLSPRVLPALTFALGSAGGAGVTYAIMRGQAAAQAHNDTAADTRKERYRAPELVVVTAEPAPPSVDPIPQRGGTTATADPRAETAPRNRADAGAGTETQDDIAREQADFDQGSTAYQAGFYDDAIKAFQKHARQYPKSRYGAMREKLLTLALIRADRKAEAHQRIERLRKTNPESPLLKELDAALPPEK